MSSKHHEMIEGSGLLPRHGLQWGFHWQSSRGIELQARHGAAASGLRENAVVAKHCASAGRNPTTPPHE